MQAASQGELHFDERSLLLVEAQKLSGRADLPPRSFKTSLLRPGHGADPAIYLVQAVVVPCCSLPSPSPASILASWENGGVLIWPCSQTRGFSPGAIGST